MNPTRYVETRNSSGLGFSNGLALHDNGDYVSYDDYKSLLDAYTAISEDLTAAQGQIADAQSVIERYTWNPIETIPKDGTEVLAMRSHGWITKGQYYDNPFGRKDTVIENTSGNWWSASFWMHVPNEFSVDVWAKETDNPA